MTSVSLPSKLVYVVDIPEVKKFNCEFSYNFHTPDERVNELGRSLPKSFKHLTVDAEFIDYVRLRIPRFVTMKWTKPNLSRSPIEKVVTTNVSKINIKRNLRKVMSEDAFASLDFSTVNFTDGNIESKIYSHVSGSVETMFSGVKTDHEVTMQKFSSFLKKNLTSTLDKDVLFSAITDPKQSKGTIFSRDAKTIANSKLKKLSEVRMNVQLSSKLMFDIVNRGTNDPFNQYVGDLGILKDYAEEQFSSAKKNLTNAPSEVEFKTIVPFVDIQVLKTPIQQERYPIELIGYIIDKIEIADDGRIVEHPTLTVEGIDITSFYDPDVRYGTTYVYGIRTVAVYTLPGSDLDTNDRAILKVLVSSKQTKFSVRTTEEIAPPPPADLGFVWDYEVDKLIVHWAFPTNSQRDIKKFQVFRRASLDHPFELLKEYNFDDSIIKQNISENPDVRVVEILKSPKTYFVDDEFTRQSKFVYAICSVDAHGLTSNYSMQIYVEFDEFKNKINKQFISHSGAPKPYPNMYIAADALVDTIRTTGMNNMRIYLNPQNYNIITANGKLTKTLATKNLGESYRLQFINLDNQKGGLLTVDVDDRRTKK